MGEPTVTQQVIKLLRPRQPFEGAGGPLSPTDYTLFNPVRCPKNGVHFFNFTSRENWGFDFLHLGCMKSLAQHR